MPQFLIDSKHIRGEEILIRSRKTLRHIKALRIVAGEELLLMDETGMRYSATIESISPDGVKIKIVENIGRVAKDFRLVLAQAIPKSTRMDLVVEKATELGVDRMIPFFSSRTEVSGRLEGKVARWNRVAEAAMKQSVRVDLILIDEPKSFEEMVDELEGDKLMLWEKAEPGSFKAGLEKSGRTISLVIGPEGGFSEAEVQLFRDKGGKVVSFGENILRTETAGLAAVAAVLFHLGVL